MPLDGPRSGRRSGVDESFARSGSEPEAGVVDMAAEYRPTRSWAASRRLRYLGRKHLTDTVKFRSNPTDPSAATATSPHRSQGDPMPDITIDEFRDEVTAFLDANAAEEAGRAEVRLGRGRRRRRPLRGGRPPRPRRASLERGQGVAGQALRRRPRLDHRPDRVRRPRAARAPTTGVYGQLEAQYETPEPELLRHRPRHGGARRSTPTPPRRSRTLYLPQDVPRRHRRLPALQRARRRLRPRQPADQGRARRRRVDHHRPEGVDLRRPVQRHRRDHLPHRRRPAQAQGPHRLRRRHEGARRRDPAAAPDDRRRHRSTRCSSPRCACPTTTASAT